jgi:ABC-type sugar transport system permease subunit
VSDNTAAAAPPAPSGGSPSAGGRSPRARRRFTVGPLPWILPAIALIAVVVIWPVVTMVISSRERIGMDGFVRGPAGWHNFTQLFGETVFGHVLLWTVIWTVSVVGLTMLLSLGLAALFNQNFPGRRVTRWALIAPWAASVLMTAIGFRWMLDRTSGILNRWMVDLGLINSPQDWLGKPSTAWPWMIFVAIFVSLPFTTYTLLAGLQTIPGDVHEAARIDGASGWQAYLRITLPLLRPAFLVGLVINLINVFNSFPVIWGMNEGGVNYANATTTVFMYGLKGHTIGESAAMSVVNFVLVLLMVLVFLRISRWNKED